MIRNLTSSTLYLDVQRFDIIECNFLLVCALTQEKTQGVELENQFLAETKFLLNTQLQECAISVVVCMEMSARQVLMPSMGVNEEDNAELSSHHLKVCVSCMVQDIGQDGRVV